MSNIIKYLSAFILGILLMYFLSGNCKGEQQTVLVPEVKGTFKAQKPEHRKLELNYTSERIPGQKWSNSATLKNGQNLSKNDKSEKTKKSPENKSKIDSLLALNSEITRKFNELNSKEKTKKYQEAIELKEFSKKYEDSTISISACGLVRGVVEELGFDYTIKERKIPVKQPILIMGGVTAGATKNFDKNVISASAGVQLRNGKQLEVGFDTEQRILVGVKAPIFKIK